MRWLNPVETRNPFRPAFVRIVKALEELRLRVRHVLFVFIETLPLLFDKRTRDDAVFDQPGPDVRRELDVVMPL